MVNCCNDNCDQGRACPDKRPPMTHGEAWTAVALVTLPWLVILGAVSLWLS